jgi:hypothetical protein
VGVAPRFHHRHAGHLTGGQSRRNHLQPGHLIGQPGGIQHHRIPRLYGADRRL